VGIGLAGVARQLLDWTGMKPSIRLCLFLPLSLAAALGPRPAEAQCYERTLNGWELRGPHVAAAADGRMVVLWKDDADHVTAVAADGTPGATRDLPRVGNWWLDTNTVLASGPDSHLLVAAPLGLEIQALALSADGEPRSVAWLGVADVPYGQYGTVPDVIWDEDSFVLAWSVDVRPEDAPDQKYRQLRVARVDAHGILRGEIVDVPGATAAEAPLVRIVRTGSVLWLVWSAGVFDDTGYLRGMRLATDLTALDDQPIQLHGDGRLHDVAGHADRALLLAGSDQAGTDLLVSIDEDGLASVEAVTSLLETSDERYLQLFATPTGGYQLMEAARYDGDVFPRAWATYQVRTLDAGGHPIDADPLLLPGSTPSGAASQLGTLFVWAQDQGTFERGTSRIVLRMPDGQEVTVVDEELFVETTEVPCPPPPSDPPDCGTDTTGPCFGCSTGGGPTGLAAAGVVLVAAVVAARRRRR
jgi:MYXO-CTERM domain-containing protein